MGAALVSPKMQFTSAAGAPLANGTVTIYVAGSTTPTNTWQDEALTALNTNPITLDSRGECVIWTDPTVVYKLLLKNAGGVTQYTVDNISGAMSRAQILTLISSTITSTMGASGGSALVGFLQAGTGAAARTGQAKLREFVTPEDFYLAAESDQTGMIQRALNTIGLTSRGVRFNPAADYTISDTLTVTSKAKFNIFGAGRITQTVANKPILSLTSCTEFDISGIYLHGLGTDFTPASDTGIGDGIRVETCSNFAIHHNTFKNFGAAGVRVRGGCFDFSITDNNIYGTDGITTAVAAGNNYQFGVLVQSGTSLAAPCTDFEVSRNKIRKTAMGVRVEPGCSRYSLNANVLFDIKGQHGFYLNGTVFSVTANTMGTISYDGIKMQSYQGGVINEGIAVATVSGNTVSGCLIGISLEKTSSLANDARSVNITGNTIDGATDAGYGIFTSDCTNLVVEGNSVKGGAYGIIGNVTTAGRGVSGRISGNSVMDTRWAGIFGYAYESLSITDNTIIRPCVAAAAGDPQSAAIYVGASGATHRAQVANNVLVTGTSTGVVNGLFAAAADVWLGDNDFEAKPLSMATATMRKRTMFGDYEGRGLWASIGTIANGATTSKTFTVTGVVVTDRVLSVSLASDLQGCSLTGYVTTDTLTVVITNNTGSNKTIADAFVRYSIMRYAI